MTPGCIAFSLSLSRLAYPSRICLNRHGAQSTIPILLSLPNPPTFPPARSFPPSRPLDLWSNACVRCPEALDKLNMLAGSLKEDVEKGLVFFASVNIDDKAKARGLVAERYGREGGRRVAELHAMRAYAIEVQDDYFVAPFFANFCPSLLSVLPPSPLYLFVSSTGNGPTSLTSSSTPPPRRRSRRALAWRVYLL